MTEDLIFKTNALFQSVTYDRDCHIWHFCFADQIRASPFGFWRILESDKIVFVSEDEGQQFGLPKPRDLEKEIPSKLLEKRVTEVKVDKDSGDLTLTISDNIEIQIFISSSGYESYELVIEGNKYIGLGSGGIGIVERTENPQFFTTREL